jgi:hypothetical protein
MISQNKINEQIGTIMHVSPCLPTDLLYSISSMLIIANKFCSISSMLIIAAIGIGIALRDAL